MAYQLKDKLFFGSHFADQIQFISLWQTQNQKMEVSYHSDNLKLGFSYPFEMRNLFTNEILQHLVTTINKSPFTVFTVKTICQQERAFKIKFQLNGLQFGNPMPINNSSSVQILVPMKLHQFPRKIYDRIVYICQLYTIKHSQLAQANEFLDFLQTLQNQQDIFLGQIDLFLKQLTINGSKNIEIPKNYDIKYPFDV